MSALREELIEAVAQTMHTTVDLHGVCECGFNTYRDPERWTYHQAAVAVDAVLDAAGGTGAEM